LNLKRLVCVLSGSVVIDYMFNEIKQKLQWQFADKDFSEILKGSAVTLVARVMATGLALISSLIVARSYGAEATGILAIVQTSMLLMSIFAVLGTNVSILRLIPEHIAKYSVTSAFKVYNKIQLLVIFCSIVVGFLIFIASGPIAENIFKRPQYSYVISITAIFVIFRAVMDLNTESLRGIRSIRGYAFILLVPNVAMLLVLFVLWNFSESVNDPVYAQIAGWGVTAVVGSVLMRGLFKRRLKPDEKFVSMRAREILDISAPMLMTASMNFVIGQVGILILGMYRSPAEVGYYSIAVKLATLTTFVLQAINSMAAPKFSELFHTERMDELFRVAKKSTKLIFWTTSPILVCLVVLGTYILSIFGPGFQDAYIPLLILVCGQFINSISGSTGYFMNMTGHQKIYRNIVLLSSAINLILCFSLIPMLGLLGAALSSSICLVLWNSMIMIFIKIKYRRTIGYLPLIG